ncbi:MAG TPA: 16S rRNA (guanine(966)-N(2))-methyltransferase RsmD [Burkholderiaceae bacterium]
MQKSIRKPAGKPVAKAAHKPAHAPRQVRIIGGAWKRTPLAVVDADGLRPTPDRVRETVFNWLNHLLDGAWERSAFLDLFAGSGALGFEAASRGARQVISVEAFTPAVRQMEEVKAKLKADAITILRGDALATADSLARRGQRFDVIFLDPPFQQEWLDRVLPLCPPLLAEGGLVYVEWQQSLAAGGAAALPAWMDGWEVVRADKAGMVFFHLLQRK